MNVRQTRTTKKKEKNGEMMDDIDEPKTPKKILKSLSLSARKHS